MTSGGDAGEPRDVTRSRGHHDDVMAKRRRKIKLAIIGITLLLILFTYLFILCLYLLYCWYWYVWFWSPSRCPCLNTSMIWVTISFKLSTITFKALGSGRPPYLASLLHNPPRTMHSSLQVRAIILHSAHVLFVFLLPHLELAPTEIQNVRECSSLASFRNHLKTHYFSSAFSVLWHLIHTRLDSN